MHIYLYYYCSNWNVRWCCAEAFPVGADLVGFCVLRFNISIPIRRRLFLNILWIVETVSFIFMSTENQCVPTFGRKEKDHLYTVTQSYLSLWFFTFQLRFGPLIFSATFYLDTYGSGTHKYENGKRVHVCDRVYLSLSLCVWVWVHIAVDKHLEWNDDNNRKEKRREKRERKSAHLCKCVKNDHCFHITQYVH